MYVNKIMSGGLCYVKLHRAGPPSGRPDTEL